MKKVLALGIFVIFYFPSFAQDLSLYEKHIFISNGDSLPYRLLLPQNYDSTKKYPLVFFLHGAGERGNDNEKQLTHGATLFLKENVRKDYPAIVAFPQCPENSFWSNMAISRDNEEKAKFEFSTAGDQSSDIIFFNFSMAIK